jgi:hypothetical protein
MEIFVTGTIVMTALAVVGWGCYFSERESKNFWKKMYDHALSAYYRRS